MKWEEMGFTKKQVQARISENEVELKNFFTDIELSERRKFILKERLKRAMTVGAEKSIMDKLDDKYFLRNILGHIED